MFHQGARIPGSHSLLEGEGKTSRVMKIGNVEEAEKNKHEIEKIVMAWCNWKEQK